MTNLEELKRRVGRLQELLEDPNPGLPSWQNQYLYEMKAISEFWIGSDLQMTQGFMQAVGSAHWQLNLLQFCERAGFEPNDYGKQKFTEFQQLNGALSKFDPETLSRIIWNKTT